MNDAPILPLTWDQWGAILIPIYILVILWARWCMQSKKPAPPRIRRQKETPK